MAIDSIPQKKRLAMCKVIMRPIRDPYADLRRVNLAVQALADLYERAGYAVIARSLRGATLAEARQHAQGILFAFKE